MNTKLKGLFAAVVMLVCSATIAGAQTIQATDTASMLNPYLRKSDTSNMVQPYVRKSDTTNMLVPYVRKPDTSFMLSRYLRKTDTANMVLPYLRKTDTATMLGKYLRKTDTANMVSPYLRKTDTAFLVSKYLRKTDTAFMLSGYARTNAGSFNTLSTSGNATIGGFMGIGGPAVTNVPLTVYGANGVIADNASFKSMTVYQYPGTPKLSVYDGTGSYNDISTSFLELGNEAVYPKRKMMFKNGEIVNGWYSTATTGSVQQGTHFAIPNPVDNGDYSSYTVSLPVSKNGTLTIENDATSTYLKKTDTAAMLSPYMRAGDTTNLLSGYARTGNLNYLPLTGGSISGNLSLPSIAGKSTAATSFLTHTNGLLQTRTAAQVLADIGAAPATSGGYLPLSGGTANTLTGPLYGGDAQFSSSVTTPFLNVIYPVDNRATLTVNGPQTATNITTSIVELVNPVVFPKRKTIFKDGELTVGWFTNNYSPGALQGATHFMVPNAADYGDYGSYTISLPVSKNGTVTLENDAASSYLKKTDTTAMLSPYMKTANYVPVDTTSLSTRINSKLNISDTANMLYPYLRTANYVPVDTASLSNRINGKLNTADTAGMLSPYARTFAGMFNTLSTTGDAIIGNKLAIGGAIDPTFSFKIYGSNGMAAEHAELKSLTLYNASNPQLDMYDASGSYHAYRPTYSEIGSEAGFPKRKSIFKNGEIISGWYTSNTPGGVQQGTHFIIPNPYDNGDYGSYTVSLPVSKNGTLTIENDAASAYLKKTDTASMLSGYVKPAQLASYLPLTGGTLSGNLTLSSISGLGTPATSFLTHSGGSVQSRTAAQVLSDIGAAPTVAGGYLPLSAGTGATLTGDLYGNGDAKFGNMVNAPYIRAYYPYDSRAQMVVTGPQQYSILTTTLLELNNPLPFPKRKTLYKEGEITVGWFTNAYATGVVQHGTHFIIPNPNDYGDNNDYTVSVPVSKTGTLTIENDATSAYLKKTDTTAMLSNYIRANNITGFLPLAGGTLTGNLAVTANEGISGALSVTGLSTFASVSVTGNQTIAGSLTVTGTATASNFSGAGTNISGTAASLTAGKATILATARTIQGVSFNGSANINILSGGGLVRMSGTTISYDASSYLTTTAAASTYALTSQLANYIPISSASSFALASQLSNYIPMSSASSFALASQLSNYIPMSSASSFALASQLANYIPTSSASSFAPATSIAGTDKYLAKFNGTSAVGSSLMYDNGTGIGIGTTNPMSLLAVNGEITAVKLTITNTGWSDYVFHKGYKLRPLTEVEKYISDNKHLPDVPSEQEVKEKGISVGDNQAVLLRKIEELTLYVIDLKKEIDGLKKSKKRSGK